MSTFLLNFAAEAGMEVKAKTPIAKVDARNKRVIRISSFLLPHLNEIRNVVSQRLNTDQTRTKSIFDFRVSSVASNLFAQTLWPLPFHYAPVANRVQG